MERKRSIATIVRDVLREEDELDDEDDVRRRLSLLDSSLHEEDEEEREEAINRMEGEVKKRIQSLDNDLKDVDKKEIRAACKETLEGTSQEGCDLSIAGTDNETTQDSPGVRETVSEDTRNGESLENNSVLDTQSSPDSKVSNTKVIMEL